MAKPTNISFESLVGIMRIIFFRNTLSVSNIDLPSSVIRLLPLRSNYQSSVHVILNFLKESTKVEKRYKKLLAGKYLPSSIIRLSTLMSSLSKQCSYNIEFVKVVDEGQVKR